MLPFTMLKCLASCQVLASIYFKYTWLAGYLANSYLLPGWFSFYWRSYILSFQVRVQLKATSLQWPCLYATGT